MNKPKGYDDVQLSAVLNAGGHKCVIRSVEETKSKTGKEMLIIEFDTSPEDTQPGFYMNRYLADQKNPAREAKWYGRQYLVTEGEYGTENLARFNTSVAHSNDEETLVKHKWKVIERNAEGKAISFDPPWGKNFGAGFTDLKVGIVFRIEEYNADSGELRTAVKPFRFCDYNNALEQAVPKRKEVQPQTQQPSLMEQFQNQAQEEFMQIPDGLNDEGLPFH